MIVYPCLGFGGDSTRCVLPVIYALSVGRILHSDQHDEPTGHIGLEIRMPTLAFRHPQPWVVETTTSPSFRILSCLQREKERSLFPRKWATSTLKIRYTVQRHESLTLCQHPERFLRITCNVLSVIVRPRAIKVVLCMVTSNDVREAFTCVVTNSLSGSLCASSQAQLCMGFWRA